MLCVFARFVAGMRADIFLPLGVAFSCCIYYRVYASLMCVTHFFIDTVAAKARNEGKASSFPCAAHRPLSRDTHTDTHTGECEKSLNDRQERQRASWDIPAVARASALLCLSDRERGRVPIKGARFVICHSLNANARAAFIEMEKKRERGKKKYYEFSHEAGECFFFTCVCVCLYLNIKPHTYRIFFSSACDRHNSIW